MPRQLSKSGSRGAGVQPEWDLYARRSRHTGCRRIVFTLLCFGLFACGESGELSSEPSLPSVAIAREPDVASQSLSLWRGEYVHGHEVNSFCPCGDELCYWVRAEPALQVSMNAVVEEGRRHPYEPYYLEFDGRLLVGEELVGFARDYAGLIEVVDVRVLRRWRDDCR